MLMVLWSTGPLKEINANENRHSLWEYSKRFHCSFEWHLNGAVKRTLKITKIAKFESDTS